MKILVVDDEKLLVKGIKFNLENDGYTVVTGCDGVITAEDFAQMKDGAICCNAGHFDCEVAVAELAAMAVSVKPARKNIIGYTLANGHKIYILAEGRLVNLAAGDGHPAEIMDMSFAIQALSARWLVSHKDTLTRKPGSMVIEIPAEIDDMVARRKLASWGYEIDTLTDEDITRICDDCAPAREEWLRAVAKDADKEYGLGDVSQETLDSFVRKLK